MYPVFQRTHPGRYDRKVIRARIPVLVSNGAPTDRAVALARKYHVTLICSAHMDAMDIFSAKEFWED